MPQIETTTRRPTAMTRTRPDTRPRIRHARVEMCVTTCLARCMASKQTQLPGLPLGALGWQPSGLGRSVHGRGPLPWSWGPCGPSRWSGLAAERRAAVGGVCYMRIALSRCAVKGRRRVSMERHFAHPSRSALRWQVIRAPTRSDCILELADRCRASLLRTRRPYWRPLLDLMRASAFRASLARI
jgi:hypothetical protein